MSVIDNEQALKTFNKMNGVLEKHFGEGVFVDDISRPIPRTPSGIFVVDYILGGGLPRGMITEIFGPESTGKTTFAALCAATHQKEDPNNRILYLDFEHTVSKRYFQALGVDTDRPRFFLTQPTTLEEGFFIAREMMNKGIINFFIWDTPGASQPAAIVNAPLDEKSLREGYRDIESGKSGTGTIGVHARTFSHGLAALIPAIAKTGSVAVFPNQIRTKIESYGAGETTPGGRALKFHCAIRIRLSKVETKKESISDDFFGTKKATATENVVQFHTIKNKTYDPFRVCTARLAYGRGFLDHETTVDLAIKRKIIQQSAGGNFTLHDGSHVRGTELLLGKYTDTAMYEQLKTAIIGTKPADDEYAEVPTGVDISDDAEDELPEEEGRVTL